MVASRGRSLEDDGDWFSQFRLLVRWLIIIVPMQRPSERGVAAADVEKAARVVAKVVGERPVLCPELDFVGIGQGGVRERPIEDAGGAVVHDGQSLVRDLAELELDARKPELGGRPVRESKSIVSTEKQLLTCRRAFV